MKISNGSQLFYKFFSDDFPLELEKNDLLPFSFSPCCVLPPKLVEEVLLVVEDLLFKNSPIPEANPFLDCLSFGEFEPFAWSDITSVLRIKSSFSDMATSFWPDFSANMALITRGSIALFAATAFGDSPASFKLLTFAPLYIKYWATSTCPKLAAS